MIVSLHVATGAAAGHLAGSRRRALLLGPVLHVAGDRVPHDDIPSRRFEIASGLVCLAALALRRGPLDPATIGAAAASAPDVEHVVPQLRPRGRRLFHRRPQRDGGLTVAAQLLAAGYILGVLLGPRSRAKSRAGAPNTSTSRS